MQEMINESLKLLELAVQECCKEKKVGLVFSAGIDSTLIGVLASRHSSVEAYAVGIKESHDLDYARKIQKEAPFNIHYVEISEEEIEKELPRIVKIAKSASPLDISVGVPFFFSSKQAAAEGIKTMLCGQGGDELFGGYNKYIECLAKESYEKLEEMMRKDLDELPSSNLSRDKAMCKSNGVELEIPFLNKKFVGYVQQIPVQLKVKEFSGMEKPEYGCVDEVEGMRFIRKYVQRKMAEAAGVPTPVIQRAKKAAQYGSGSQKTLEKLARKNGFKKKASEAGRRDYTQMYLETLLAG
jgi:asparagine synthase (glutamine-hydrolysing)